MDLDVVDGDGLPRDEVSRDSAVFEHADRNQALGITQPRCTAAKKLTADRVVDGRSSGDWCFGNRGDADIRRDAVAKQRSCCLDDSPDSSRNLEMAQVTADGEEVVRTFT